jgi:hypothetical protein
VSRGDVRRRNRTIKCIVGLVFLGGSRRVLQTNDVFQNIVSQFAQNIFSFCKRKTYQRVYVVFLLFFFLIEKLRCKRTCVVVSPVHLGASKLLSFIFVYGINTLL